jgi:hypothetical protein
MLQWVGSVSAAAMAAAETEAVAETDAFVE